MNCVITIASVCCIHIVVARCVVLTSDHFKFVTHAVAIRIIEAVAVAIEVFFSVFARSVFVGGFCIVVAGRVVDAATDFHKEGEFTSAVEVHRLLNLVGAVSQGENLVVQGARNRS